MKKRLLHGTTALLSVIFAGSLSAGLPSPTDFANLANTICGSESNRSEGKFVNKPLFGLVGETTTLEVVNAEPIVTWVWNWGNPIPKRNVDRPTTYVDFARSEVVSTEDYNAIASVLTSSYGTTLGPKRDDVFNNRGIGVLGALSYFDYNSYTGPTPNLNYNPFPLLDEGDVPRDQDGNPLPPSTDTNPITYPSESFPSGIFNSDVITCDANYLYVHNAPTVGQIKKPLYGRTKLTPGINRFTVTGGTIDTLSRNAQNGKPVQYVWRFGSIDFGWSFNKVTTTPYVDVPVQYGGQHEASVTAFDGTFESEPSELFFLVDGPRQCTGLACRVFN